VRIPKVIHRIWLGDAEMPETYVRFGETWRRHHPDWEMRLWTTDRLPALTCPGGFERCRNFGEASDVLRYEILSRDGGVYVDTDVECLRSLEPLIGDATAFAAYARPGLIGSAVVGSVPGHPAIAKALAVVCAGAGSGRQVEATGPVALTRVLEGAEGVELFGRETFYPFDYWEIPFTDIDALDLGEAYAIHHWHATWQTREALMRRTRALMFHTQRLAKRERRARRRQDRLRTRLAQAQARLEKARRRERLMRRQLERIERTPWRRLTKRLRGARRRFKFDR
jgi:inositol phosphorylceramide mannosyltransferase catalytic subunit